MSWTDIFPVLSDELVEEFQALVTPEERLELETWLGVERIIPPHQKAPGQSRPVKRKRHLVSATLFWKHVQGADPDLPVPSRERLVMSKRLGPGETVFTMVVVCGTFDGLHGRGGGAAS